MPKLWPVCVVLCCVYVLCICPLTPGGSGGQFMIWLWCYNTIGLQWCCSSSLTLLAPPTGPLLPTPLLLCLLGFAPCSRQAMYGWPMRRWRPWQPLPKRSVPLCPSPSPVFFLSVMCVDVRVTVRGRVIWITNDGDGMHHLTPFLVCELPNNTNLWINFSLRSLHPNVLLSNDIQAICVDLKAFCFWWWPSKWSSHFCYGLDCLFLWYRN